MVHLGRSGNVLDFPAVLAGVVAGRAGQGNFSGVTRESQVPWGDYLYMQSVIKSSRGKPAYTRLFIDIADTMFYHVQPDRALIMNNREVAAFFPASEPMAKDFLHMEGTLGLIRQLCDLVGKDQASVSILPS